MWLLAVLIYAFFNQMNWIIFKPLCADVLLNTLLCWTWGLLPLPIIFHVFSNKVLNISYADNLLKLLKYWHFPFCTPSLYLLTPWKIFSKTIFLSQKSSWRKQFFSSNCLNKIFSWLKIMWHGNIEISRYTNVRMKEIGDRYFIGTVQSYGA